MKVNGPGRTAFIVLNSAWITQPDHTKKKKEEIHRQHRTRELIAYRSRQREHKSSRLVQYVAPWVGNKPREWEEELRGEASNEITAVSPTR